MSDYCGLRGCVTKPGDDCEIEHCPRFSGRKRIAELEASLKAADQRTIMAVESTIKMKAKNERLHTRLQKSGDARRMLGQAIQKNKNTINKLAGRLHASHKQEYRRRAECKELRARLEAAMTEVERLRGASGACLQCERLSREVAGLREDGEIYRSEVELSHAVIEEMELGAVARRAEVARLREIEKAARIVLANHGGPVYQAPADIQALAYAVGVPAKENDHE